MFNAIKILLLFCAIFVSDFAEAQCRGFAKNICRPEMEQYVPNENFNSARLMPGDEAEVNLTFYSGQDYRLLVCNHPILEAVEFKVESTDGTTLFDNTAHDMTNKFDFRVDGTQQLKIKIKVPQGQSGNNINPQGCVAIMLGVKDIVAFQK